MTKLSIYLIPLAAAVAGAFISVSQAQAETPIPTLAAGDHADIPAGPNVSFTTKEQRDAANPSFRLGADVGAAIYGDGAMPPAGPGSMAKPAETRTVTTNDGGEQMAGRSRFGYQSGDAANPPDQPNVRL